MGKHSPRKAQQRLPHGRVRGRPMETPKPRDAGSGKKDQRVDRGRTGQQGQPALPFASTDTILLIGEGDFSFACSLFVHHKSQFQKLCATCFDSREDLLQKHPQAEEFIAKLTSASEGFREDLALAPQDTRECRDSPQASSTHSPSTSLPTLSRVGSRGEIPPELTGPDCAVLYSVDATALHKYRAIRTQKWDRIVFNFPHVGGKSTDVNRQVRYNQALVHSFLQNCLPILSKPNGTILVTIFEGAPYDLWNIRDLARSVGLQVLRSFAFHSQLYPGYEHARTCGNINPKRGISVQGERNGDVHAVPEEGANRVAAGMPSVRPGKWRGEERPARTYEFALASEAPAELRRRDRKRKRTQTGEDSQSDTPDE